MLHWPQFCKDSFCSVFKLNTYIGGDVTNRLVNIEISLHVLDSFLLVRMSFIFSRKRGRFETEVPALLLSLGLLSRGIWVGIVNSRRWLFLKRQPCGNVQAAEAGCFCKQGRNLWRSWSKNMRNSCSMKDSSGHPFGLFTKTYGAAYSLRGRLPPSACSAVASLAQIEASGNFQHLWLVS